jgi:septum formation protein
MLYLASRSPRRAQLLEQLGLRFAVLDVEVPEHRAPGESAEDYVQRVARDKAAAGRAMPGVGPGSVVLGADTEVVLGDAVFGKPADVAEAVAMLERLSGRSHRVLSAVCCMAPDGRRSEVLQQSEVHFAPLDRAAIEAYAGTGEPLGKAGGYAIQGRAAAFIRHLSGSYTGVMGLPLFETAGLLARLGHRADA